MGGLHLRVASSAVTRTPSTTRHPDISSCGAATSACPSRRSAIGLQRDGAPAQAPSILFCRYVLILIVAPDKPSHEPASGPSGARTAASAAHRGVQFASRRVTSNPLVPTLIARRAIRGYWCGHAIIVRLKQSTVVRVRAAVAELVCRTRPPHGERNKRGAGRHASMNDAASSERATGRRCRPAFSSSRSSR